MLDANFDAVDAILQFSQSKKLTLSISIENLEFLIRNEAYSTINLMVQAEVQIERSKGRPSIKSIAKGVV